jgi:hypothetical protein
MGERSGRKSQDRCLALLEREWKSAIWYRFHRTILRLRADDVKPEFVPMQSQKHSFTEVSQRLAVF